MTFEEIIAELRRRGSPLGDDFVTEISSDVLTEAANMLERLRAAALLAYDEMRHTVAPRSSFTDAVDTLDAALFPSKAT